MVNLCRDLKPEMKVDYYWRMPELFSIQRDENTAAVNVNGPKLLFPFL